MSVLKSKRGESSVQFIETARQLEALSGAMIVGGTQAAGSIQLVALGDKPTIDIPVTLIIRRDL